MAAGERATGPKGAQRNKDQARHGFLWGLNMLALSEVSLEFKHNPGERRWILKEVRLNFCQPGRMWYQYRNKVS